MKLFRAILISLLVIFLLALTILTTLASLAYFAPTLFFNTAASPWGVSAQKINFQPEGSFTAQQIKLGKLGTTHSLSMEWEWLGEKVKIKSVKINNPKLSVSEIQKLWNSRKHFSSSSNKIATKSEIFGKKIIPALIFERIAAKESLFTFPSGEKVLVASSIFENQSGQHPQLTIDSVESEWASAKKIKLAWDWEEIKRGRAKSLAIFDANINVEKISSFFPNKKETSSPSTKQKTASNTLEQMPSIEVGSALLENIELTLPGNRHAFVKHAELKETDIVRFIINNLLVDDLARVETIKIEWTWEGLRKREVEYLDAAGADVFLDGLLAASEKEEEEKKEKTPSSQNSQQGFHLKELRVRQSQLRARIFGKRLPYFVLPIAQASPDIVFKNLYLGGSKDDPAASLPVETVIQDYTLTSPYDGISPMLSFGKIRVVFSWKGLQEKKIEQLQIIDPTIYIGNDLFWFTEDIRKANEEKKSNQQSQKTESSEDSPKDPWKIGVFSASGGRIELSHYGRNRIPLPFHFAIEPHFNLIVSDFTQMHLKTQCEIPPTTIEYPSYGPLRFVNLSGKMEFSLPVSTANNIINTLQVEKIEWKKLRASGGQLWVTYDARGIYGGFYARAYGGDVGGDFTFYWDQLKWVGSCYTKSVDVEPVTHLLYPENFIMSGPVDSRLVVRGREREILGMGGGIDLNQNGKMQVVAIDELLERLPQKWTPFKRKLVMEGLKAFRDYDYQKGWCEFAYAPPESFLKLNLNGLQGKRNFDIRWHDKGRTLTSIEVQ